jgi:hypothetical protein
MPGRRWSNPVRPGRRPLVSLILALLIVPAGCGLWLVFGYDNGTRHVATLDSLPIPDTWEVVQTTKVGTFPLGSHAERWYLVDSAPVDTAALVKGALQPAGWTIEQRFDSNGSPIEDCRANPGGPIECTIYAYRRTAVTDERFEAISISIPAKGRGLDEVQVQGPEQYVVRISAHTKSDRDLFHAPTPSPSE